MICPIKNKKWNAMEETYGVDAYAINRLGGIPSSTSFEGDSPLFQLIYSKVASDVDYYAKKYASYLNGKVREMSPLALTKAFYYRVQKYEGTDKLTEVGLFPTTNTEYKQAVRVPNLFMNVLTELKSKFGIDFNIMDDPDLDFKGHYTNEDGNKLVTINVAHAKLDTLFHEYYHPFVRGIKNNSPELYESLLTQAKTTTEEGLVQKLGEMAAAQYPTSLLSRFLTYVSRLLKSITGYDYNLTGKSTLEEVVQHLLDNKVDVSAENTLMTAYQAKKIYAGAEKIEREKWDVDVIPILKEQSKDVKTSDDTSFYQDLSGNDIAKRLTAFVGDKEEGEFSIRLKDKNSSYAEYEVRKIYAENRLDESANVTVGGKEFTFQELVDKVEKENSSNRLYGKAGHAYFQYLIERDPALKAEAKANMEMYENQMDAAGRHTGDLQVVTKDFETLLKLIGVEEGDRVASEISLISNELTTSDGFKIGTTADGIAQHTNGELTLFDLKFGAITSDMYISRIMEYSKSLNIKDSKLSRAYLELAFRAMIIKEKFPDAKFRSIKLVKVNSKGDHRAMELDLGTYLELINNYYSKTNPTLAASLTEKGMFDVTNYQGTSAVVMKYAKAMEKMSLPVKLEYVENKLKSLTLYSNERSRDSTYVQQERAVLAQLYLELTKMPEANLKRDTDDISGITGQLKNLSDIKHPQVQALHSELNTVRNAMRKEFHEISKKEQELFKDVLLEAAPDTETKSWIKRISTGGLAAAVVAVGIGATPLWLVAPVLVQLYLYRTNSSPKDLFGFMWRQHVGASKGYYLNMGDTYSKNGTEIALTEAQKAYRSYVVETMRDKYKELMQTRAYGTERGKKMKYYEILQKPPELPVDFLPRVPKTTDELRLEQSFNEEWFGLKVRAKDFVRDHFTSFFEENFEGKDEAGLPIRYYGHAGSHSVENSLHSFNVSQAFGQFMGSMMTKEYYDPLYALATGVRDSVNLATDEAGKAKYPNLTQFIDREIMMQIWKDTPRDRVTSADITFTVGKWGAPILGMPVGTKLVVNQHRALSALKQSVSFAIMSFKVVGATFNGVMITLINAMNESKAAIASVLGIPPELVHAKAGVSLAAYNDYKNYIKGTMTGKESKLGKLAEVFDWIPESYDYVATNKNLLYDVTSPGAFSHAFMFHNAVETWGSMVHLSMMLRSVTVENAKGEKFSLWDAYGEDGKWSKGERGVTVVGDSTVKLEGLDAREIKALKRQYEKMHGSYRYEEKTAIEATLIGQFIMQFKKYFFSYLKNLYASPYTDTTVGQYVIDKSITRPDGVPTWKWESEVMQGRLRVLASAVMGSEKFKDYLGVGLDASKEQRLRQVRLLELGNTILWVIGITFAIGFAFDDDEKESYAYKRMLRLRDDMSQGGLPKDFFAAIQQPVAAADKFAKTGKAFFDWMTLQKNKDGSRKGAAELIRNVPVLNNAKQLSDLFSSSSAEQEYLFGIIPKYETSNR